MRRRTALGWVAASYVLGAGCVPTPFTYADGGGGGAGGAGGGPDLCGNGALDPGEECDAADAASDDHADSVVGDGGPDAACTTSCKRTVQWTATYPDGTSQTMFRGIAVTAGEVHAGGVVVAPGQDPLDLQTVQYSAERLLVRWPRAGGAPTRYGPSIRDYPSGVLGMTLGPDGVPRVLQSEHKTTNPGYVGAMVAKWEGDAEAWRTGLVSAPQDGKSVLSPLASDGAVYAAGSNFATLRVTKVEPSGAETNLIDQPGTGNPDLAVAARGAGGGGAAGVFLGMYDQVHVYDATGQVQYQHPLPLGFTAACTRPDGTAVFVGWVLNGAASYDAHAAIVAEQTGVTWSTSADGPIGGWDGANAVACLPDGSFVVAGQEAVDPDYPANFRNAQAVVRKYAADGTLRWTRTHRSPIEDSSGYDSETAAYAVAVDDLGYVYVAGREMANQATSVAWIRKYAP